MKKLSIGLLLILTNQAFGQKQLLKKIKIDSTTKIIGRYPHYDKSKTFENYNFIIEDSVQIAQFIKKLQLGDEIENVGEDPSFQLTVVKNHKEIYLCTVNPTLRSILTEGHTYKFDMTQIANLNKQFPFNYYHEIKIFNSKSEYQDYLAEQKNNPKFLFDYKPQFKYEGSFEIEFPKNDKFPHPKAISGFLRPYIEKIINKDDYTLGYVVNEKNRNNREQYTMTIEGPKKLFDQLKVDQLKNENWQAMIEDAHFFYKK